MFDGIDAGSWGEIIVGVVAIIVGVYVVVRWQVEKRKIAYQIRTNSIIRVDGVHSDEIEIKFKGTEVKTLTLFSISIKNLGNRPILKTDWEKPAEIIFDSKETKILDVKIASSYPSGLDVSTSISENEEGVVATIKPLLLNAKEGFSLYFIASEFSGAKIRARIVGISDLNNIDQEVGPFRRISENWRFSLALMAIPVNLIFFLEESNSGSFFGGALDDGFLFIIFVSINVFLVWVLLFYKAAKTLEEYFVEK